ncbi:MAG: PAS domain-containing protein, partial [Bacteroidetes bacterium]|nr:PAS domain-containing protein [Bacteroidota bacterium]
MIIRQIHHLLPFKKLFRLVFGMALVLQLVIISYNHFSGYHELNDFGGFVIRLIRGISYSMIAGFAIVYPDLFVIQFLNRKFQWSRGVLKRAIIQFSLMLVIAIAVSSLITTFAHWVSSYPQGLQNVLFNNALIYCVVNAFFMSILEAWIYLDESIKEKLRSEKLQQELIKEAANRAMYEAQIKIEEEQNKYSRQLIEQEKRLNTHLEEEMKKREAITIQLNENREQLDSILLNLAGAAYRCYLDEHYTMKYISEKIFDISGYHASEFIENDKLSYASIIHPDDRELGRKSILEATSEKRHYEFEYRIIHKNGQVVWVNENGKGIYSESEELKFLDGIIIDITRRKLAEIQVKDTERKYKDLLDLLPQPVFELNLKGEVMLSNKAGDAFFGPLPNEPDKKQSALDCFIPEDRPRIVENFKKSAQGITTEPGEFTAIKIDGSHCPVMVFGNPIIRNGEIVG